eukprot:gb/GECH01000762.1/.p1 GENE.gb/GECH01000762.1/~~gb/GECH01000762.1/.p1  ORF type:complete len:213 (+),score=41.03 gb/GECH01000762.1/:1-639(+)
MTLGSITSRKSQLRKTVKQRIKSLNQTTIQEQGKSTTSRLFNSNEYKQAKSLGVYVSFKTEIDTIPIINNALSQGKKLYVPYISDTVNATMTMLHVSSLVDFQSFEKNKWGILEPPTDSIASRTDVFDTLDLDLIVTPGLAFDARGGRLGRGKGYYDKFFAKYSTKTEGKIPFLVALSLTEQLVDEVPMLDYDQYLNRIITPSAVFPTGHVE